MIFYGPESSKGIMPRRKMTDRNEPLEFKGIRVAVATVFVIVAIIAYFALQANELLQLAQIVRTVGELITGALIGVFLSERETSKIINIYVSKETLQ